MCLLCVSKSGGARGVRQLVNSWQGPAVSQAAQACEHAPKAAGQRLFSSGQPALPNVKDGKVAHPDLLNENLLKAQYAVRGELYNKAMELQKTGRELIFTNGGRRSPPAACFGLPALQAPGHCCGCRRWLISSAAPPTACLQWATRSSWARSPSLSTGRCAPRRAACRLACRLVASAC
jgi:hypothetical protein